MVMWVNDFFLFSLPMSRGVAWRGVAWRGGWRVRRGVACGVTRPEGESNVSGGCLEWWLHGGV